MISRRHLMSGTGALAVTAGKVATANSTAGPIIVTDITVQFATNRNKIGPNSFGPDLLDPTQSSPNYYTGAAKVKRSGPGLTDWQLASVEIDPGMKPQEARTLAAGDNGIASFLARIGMPRVSLSNATAAKAMIYLHGYNTSFVDAVEAAAAVSASYGVSHVYAFSWPSYGAWYEYRGDQNHAYASGIPISSFFEELLSILSATSDGDRPLLDLVIHSMGARAFSASMQILSKANPKKLEALIAQKYFQRSILIAADEDYDSLTEKDKLKPLISMSQEINVYTNVDDKAMIASGQVNARQALGLAGPADFEEVFRTLLPNVYQIICDGAGDDLIQHRYFETSPIVTADIAQVLAGRYPADVQPRTNDEGELKGRRFSLAVRRLAANCER